MSTLDAYRAQRAELQLVRDAHERAGMTIPADCEARFVARLDELHGQLSKAERAQLDKETPA